MQGVNSPTWADFRAAVRAQIARQLAHEADEAAALRADVLPKVEAAITEARREGQVGRVWLFGSYAWGQPSQSSDVDLLVEGCLEPFQLAAAVSGACDRDVHVIERAGAPEPLVSRALAQGHAL
jgi:predicted nucleotidyltransferase